MPPVPNNREKFPMLELTQQQQEAVASNAVAPVRLVNPQTQETFVLLRNDEYERLTTDDYDDSPWSRDELEALAWHNAERAGSDDDLAQDQS